MQQTKHNYGKCHACGAIVEERPVDHTIQEGDDWLQIRAVPTGVCTKCGEQVLQWQVAERLEAITRERRQAQPVGEIHVPVFAY